MTRFDLLDPESPWHISLRMESLVTLIGLAIVVFASTNIDDAFVLVAFFADKNFRVRDVVIGQYAGVSTLYVVSAIAALISLIIPSSYIGLLGLRRPDLTQNRHASACEALNPNVPARLLNGRAKTSAHLSAAPFRCTSPCAGFEPSPGVGPVMKCSNPENPDPRSG